MFRPLRRSNRQLENDKVIALLKNEKRAVLAVHGENDYPYAVPINYIYDENTNKIYFHGASAGQKYDALMKENKVCFTVYGNEQYKDNDWAPYMQSVVIFGKCNKVEENKLDYLRLLAKKYYPSDEEIEKEINLAGKIVQVFEITIDHICGKQIQEK